MNISNSIESILFYKNEPVHKSELVKILSVSKEEIEQALSELNNTLDNRGLSLIQTEDKVSLGTSQSSADLIEKIRKEELSKEIGKAGLETLAIILYKGAASRREIDYIRGVNSNFILRALVMRGLVERVENKADARSFLYKPTLEVLAHLGVQSLDGLPEYASIRKEIEVVETARTEDNAEN